MYEIEIEPISEAAEARARAARQKFRDVEEKLKCKEVDDLKKRLLASESERNLLFGKRKDEIYELQSTIQSAKVSH